MSRESKVTRAVAVTTKRAAKRAKALRDAENRVFSVARNVIEAWEDTTADVPVAIGVPIQELRAALYAWSRFEK